jgi:uncharacterized SAM-binding protein YcdF (DUF218 family)
MSLAALVEALLQPVGFIWAICLFVTVAALAQRRRRLATLTGGIVLLLHLLGGTNLPAGLVAGLERPYDSLTHPLPAPGADAVVMLGGSHAYSRRALVGWDAGEPSDRIFAAVELVRRGIAPTLVLGGAAYKINGFDRPDSEPLIRWLKDWRAPVGEIIPLGICRDTHDEAVKTAALVAQRHWKHVLVVTSGYHLRRAEGVFRRVGVPCTMVGAEFTGLELWGEGLQVKWVPDHLGLRLFQHWLHEEFGWVYYRLKGWI